MEGAYPLLRDVYFFRGLAREDIERIGDACHEESFASGDVIFAEGTPADKFYILLSGTVEVWKDYQAEERDLLALHSAGHLFGEMALIDDLPRSATVVARGPVRLLSMGREDFHRIITSNSSIALSIMRSVSSMVRLSNQSFVDNLRRRNSALVKANRELKRAQEKLLRAERLSVVGRFSSLILHDIRNPISVLRGCAEMILVRAGDQQTVERYGQQILAETERLGRLAGELLDYTRGEISLNMSIVDLGQLVGKAMEIVEERFASRGIEVRSDVKYKGPLILDFERMLRVLINLADNSYKAMPNGGVFTLRVDRERKRAIIEVSDTGAGMPEEVQKRLFEPFFTRSPEGGTGLGMTIVKSIVDAHDGKLTFSSTENQGTTFRISLPVVA
jgi:signal transduction histidine kinase